MATRTIAAGEFKAKCLKLMDEVAASGDTLVITKRGRPVVKVEPARGARPPLRGLHKGRGQILGDIVSPIDIEWTPDPLI